MSAGKAMRFLDLFSGCGGASIGIDWAGFEIVGAYDKAPEAVNTYNINIKSLSTKADLNEPQDFPEADAIWSSFPCKVFSRAGRPKRLLSPEINGWFATAKVINAVKPRVVILENVKSLKFHKPNCGYLCTGCFFQRRILPFLNQRYKHVSYRVINAADFGAAQVRNRLFVAASDYPIEWPETTHSIAALWYSQYTTGDYWREHGIEPTGKSLKRHQPDSKKRWRTIRDVIYDGSVHKINIPPVRPDEYYLDKPAPTLMTTEVKGTRGRHMYNSYGSPKPDRVSDYLWLAGWKRRVSIEEARKLQGFPPDFRFAGTKAQQYKQLGNSVVPIVVENVVRAVCPNNIWMEGVA